MKILDSPALEVFYDDRGTDLVLVTFNDLTFSPDGTSYWGKRLAEKLGCSAIGVVTKAKDWFPKPAVEPAIATILALTRNHAYSIAFGASMGGYAALKYSRMCDFSAVVAVSPQISINPTDVSRFDRRYKAFFKPDMHGEMRVGYDDLGGDVYVIHDPRYEVDERHVVTLRETGYPIRLASARHTDHATITCLASSAAMSAIFGACRVGDLAALRAAVARQIRRSSIRQLIIARDASGRRAAVAQRIVERVLASRPAGNTLLREEAALLSQLAELARQRGDEKSAMQYYQLCLQGYPGHLPAFMGLAALAVPRGDLTFIHAAALELAQRPRRSGKQHRALMHYASLLAALLGPIGGLLPSEGRPGETTS